MWDSVEKVGHMKERKIKMGRVCGRDIQLGELGKRREGGYRGQTIGYVDLKIEINWHGRKKNLTLERGDETAGKRDNECVISMNCTIVI
jgi:hypothetical protein